ncbi:Os05g0176901 [Oryza sativa Japonica Group]|uniref:Os05g0176901 protein n=1 Tax=Oryza sativa subsp. japonica TaxID=39947 RepID=A0A0P0WIU9_ORYSJ|nr:hypothetical protein EE612_027450 [Oryza sativa]BAS92525.1 Os05g0176901 [Oryza sativa Japonica Group]
MSRYLYQPLVTETLGPVLQFTTISREFIQYLRSIFRAGIAAARNGSIFVLYGSRRTPSSSSYSAASNSHRWRGSKNFGRIYCLMTMRKKNSSGKRIPATGIHVIPQTIKR